MLPKRRTPRQVVHAFKTSTSRINKDSEVKIFMSAAAKLPENYEPTGSKRRRLSYSSCRRASAMERPFTTLSTSSNPKQADAADKIELTDVEEGLRRLLLDVAQYIEHSSPHGDGESPKPLPEELAAAKLELRFTGGWVRDKLLGIDSHDIDVGINKMTGFQFGLRMKEYLESSGNAEKYGIGKEGALGGLHKIEANPEKSKHLETVTTKVFGLDIDLVNLRKETYSENSRNPQMEFGTPEEDALRRDATVNALFYNLTTNSIEDFTGRGFEDMRRKIIRTPLKPYQTFKDDPLRVLRLIRFASRLGYTIDPDTKAAMSNEDIKEALKLKISRERVGVELEKMLKGILDFSLICIAP